MEKPIRILVVSSDSSAWATGLASLRALPGVELLAAVGDGAEALRRVARRRPDLVLMDLLLPGRSGLQIGAALKRRPSAPKVVLVSLGNGSVYARETREFGIDGVVGRSDLAAEMPALLDKLFPGRLPRRTPRIVPADDAATPGPGARGAPEPGEPTLRSAAGR